MPLPATRSAMLLMLPMFAEIHAEARRVFRAFDAIDEADRWLRERLLE